jgi:hypothetical protein
MKQLTAAPDSSLRCRADGTFTIVQFTDLHWRNNDPLDRQTAALMAEILETEGPDLVVFTGDVLTGEACLDPAASWEQAVAPVVERGLPWAAVFGNHDDEGTLSRAGLMAVQQALPGCLSQPGPEALSGMGNYVLPVLGHDDPRPVAHLYFIDSNSYAETAIGGYGWIRRDQITWYLETAQELQTEHGSSLPALLFLHIPLPEYNDIWDGHTCYGHKLEPICSPLINTGFFAALHEAGDVMGVFAGHDHINDFIGELHGIRLAYGRATGYNTYGDPSMARGARVLRLHGGRRDFDTWLRLEGGEIVTEQPRHDPTHARSILGIS